MKKIYVSFLMLAAVFVFSYCSSSKKAAKVPVKINYQANVMTIVQTNCTPCHFPDQGGRKKPLNTYTAVSTQVDEILRRIQLDPTARGFMPDRHPKLSDADINTFKQWKADGLGEK